MKSQSCAVISDMFTQPVACLSAPSCTSVPAGGPQSSGMPPRRPATAVLPSGIHPRRAPPQRDASRTAVSSAGGAPGHAHNAHHRCASVGRVAARPPLGHTAVAPSAHESERAPLAGRSPGHAAPRGWSACCRRACHVRGATAPRRARPPHRRASGHGERASAAGRHAWRPDRWVQRCRKCSESDCFGFSGIEMEGVRCASIHAS